MWRTTLSKVVDLLGNPVMKMTAATMAVDDLCLSKLCDGNIVCDADGC